jgi:hypothetical protein
MILRLFLDRYCMVCFFSSVVDGCLVYVSAFFPLGGGIRLWLGILT